MSPAPVASVAWTEFGNVFHSQEAKGLDEYKVPLTTFNGRDAGRMAQEDLVDAFMYVTQLKMENEALKARVKVLESHIVTRIEMTAN